jgi:uncharacterized protein with PIN domain
MNSANSVNNNVNKPKFIVDFMLGRLAKWLRIFGYDTVYADRSYPENIILTSLKENRVLLTRNTGLSRKRAWKMVLIRSDKFIEQAAQVMKELKFNISEADFFTRCTFDNAGLKAVPAKESIKSKVPEYVYKTQDKFSECPVCGRIYWAGTHYGLLIKTLKKASFIK